MTRANIMLIIQAAGETEDLEAFASTMMIPTHQLAEAVAAKHFKGKIQVISVGPEASNGV
jgi:hypothetical protein